MTHDEIKKLTELKAIQYQIYDLNRKAEMIISSLQPKRKPSKKFNREDFVKEINKISTNNRQ